MHEEIDMIQKKYTDGVLEMKDSQSKQRLWIQVYNVKNFILLVRI